MKLAKSTVFCHPFLQHENGFTRILGIKKEPNGSDVKILNK